MAEERDRKQGPDERAAEEQPKRRRRRRRRGGEAEAAAEATEEKPKRSRARRAAKADKPQARAKSDEQAAESEEPQGPPEAEKPAAKPAGRSRARAAQADAPTQERPAARAGGADRPTTPPVVRAQARYVRSSARKARLVCEHLRGKSVVEARAILAYTSRAVARDWSKVLESAVANAEHNHELVGDELLVREAYADEGPTLKRYRPRAMGRATRIRKRTAHLTITLTPDLGGVTESAGRERPRRSS